MVFVTLLSLGPASCGGTSVRHHGDRGSASGTGGMNADDAGAGGTTGGSAAAAGGSGAGGMTGGSAATAGGSGGMTGDAGGMTSGSAATTGGSRATTGGAGDATGGSGAVSGAGTGSGATGGVATCDEIEQEIWTEIEKIQHCSAASECGQPIKGTSCGCTRDLVARLDADTTRFTELNETTVDGKQCIWIPNTCDCPPADGFACLNGVCTWNYVHEPLPSPDMCALAKVGAMCVVGDATQDGDTLDVGTQLQVALRPFGCFASSCAEVVRGSCQVQPDGDDFVVSAADICLAAYPNAACTGNCSESLFGHCFGPALTAGTHTVRYADNPELSVTFTVPSATGGTQCVGKLF